MIDHFIFVIERVITTCIIIISHKKYTCNIFLHSPVDNSTKIFFCIFYKRK